MIAFYDTLRLLRVKERLAKKESCKGELRTGIESTFDVDLNTIMVISIVAVGSWITALTFALFEPKETGLNGFGASRVPLARFPT